MKAPIVGEYTLLTNKGRFIRKATKVTFENGRVVRFLEKLPKGVAIREAERTILREAELAAIGVA